jgi:hypothetical protein
MAGSGARWFRYGCFGCLGVIGVLFLGCAVLFAVTWIGVRSEQVQQEVLVPEIPAAALPQVDAGRGVVLVEVMHAELIVEPAARGEPLRVEVTYDTSSFTLEESLEPSPAGEGAWSYRVSLGRTSGGGLIDSLKPFLGGSFPSLRLHLPPDAVLELGVEVAQGGAAIQLGGLSLASVEINVEQGGVDLQIDEPLLQPVERISITTAMGGANLEGLANASPKKLDLRYSMGGMTANLRGPWRNDSDITIEGSMGGGTVWLPDDVILEGLDRGGVAAPDDPELKPPTLRFTTSSAMGELHFID